MISWFHNLKVAQKLALISVFFMIPDSVMLYLFITSINENIQVARLEQLGNAYQRQLEPLLDLIPRHRLLTLEHPPGVDNNRLAIESEINAAFDALAKVDSDIGVTLEFTPAGLAKRNRQGCDVEGVRHDWEKLRREVGGLAADARDQRYVDLTAEVRSMIAHAGDTSNLILDPELDSYYLMDTTLLALPQTQDRLAQVMIDGRIQLRATGDAIERGKITLAIDGALLKQDDLDRITTSTKIALNNGNPLYGTNESFHSQVPGELDRYIAAAQRFDDLTAKIQEGGPGSVPMTDYLAAGHAARDASFKLWYVSVDALDGLLQNRINYYVYRRTRSLGVAGSALLAAILLVTFITRSISRPLKKHAGDLKAANDALRLAREALEVRVVKANAELQRSEDKYRSIFENSVMGIFQTTPDGTFVSANRALASIYGYETSEELTLGLTDISLRLYADPNRRQQFINVIQEEHAVTDFESEVCRKDGSKIWISENARAVRDPEGRLLYYEGTVTDVTAKRRAEVEERQSKIQAEKARAAAESARAAAEAASTAKSDFLATMSHEIRTPLNGVIGMVDLLSNTTLSVQQARYAKVIKSSSDGLLSLINQILDFSKIEAGKLELDFQNFDLHFAVEEVVAVVAQRASKKGLELACKIDPNVPALVRGDGDRIRQVLMNILNNAIKFTASGEVVARVAVLETLEPAAGSKHKRAVLRFAVTDTGIGIPPDRLNRLFKSFSQVDTSITRQFGGTGLGLAISKQLVELMGGQVSVESMHGKGSTFSFTVTLEQQDRAAEMPYTLEGVRAIVVDDNLTQCQVVEAQLNAWGVTTASATSAVAAIEMMQTAAASGTPFGVAIVDLSMPGMDGLGMGRAVHESEELHGVPLILMSGSDASVEAEACGFVAFMTKPIRQSHLHDALLKALAYAGNGAKRLAGERSALAESARSARLPAAKSTRILLVEDMEVNQFVVVETLARDGYTCDIANNGREGVSAATKKTYDLILMDCQMPEMSGFDAVRAIRKLELEGRGHETRVPIIALTANAVKGDREACLAAGMDDYLTKPLNPARLIATIEKFTAVAPDLSSPSIESSAGSLAAPAPLPASAGVDYPELLARCGGDRVMLGRLVEKFEKKSRQQLEDLKDGCRALDIEKTTRVAHAIKGTASNLSAVLVAGLAERLEEMGRAGDLSNAEAIVQKLGLELERCHELFRGIREARPAPETMPTATAQG